MLLLPFFRWRIDISPLSMLKRKAIDPSGSSLSEKPAVEKPPMNVSYATVQRSKVFSLLSIRSWKFILLCSAKLYRISVLAIFFFITVSRVRLRSSGRLIMAGGIRIFFFLSPIYFFSLVFIFSKVFNF